MQDISELREQLHNLGVYSSIMIPLVYTQASVIKWFDIFFLKKIKCKCVCAYVLSEYYILNNLNIHSSRKHSDILK